MMARNRSNNKKNKHKKQQQQLRFASKDQEASDDMITHRAADESIMSKMAPEDDADVSSSNSTNTNTSKNSKNTSSSNSKTMLNEKRPSDVSEGTDTDAVSPESGDAKTSDNEHGNPLTRSDILLVDAKPLVNGQDDEDDEDRTSCRVAARQLFVFAAMVWFGQIALAVALKKCGIIQRDLNDIVVQDVVPTIQQQLDFPWSSFVDTNMTQWISPFKNDSTSYWNRFNANLNVGHLMKERERPGFQVAKEGAQADLPLIMIPGFVTSGLEVWEGKECARKYFRQRMWGGISSARQFLTERECFMEHMSLDPFTGMDPENIRLRSAQGFEAADYFMPSYWVWAKILENLADVGYDGSTMSMESYDWRLAFPLLEERDGYLTKLKFKIEAYKKVTGKKVIIASHSLGAILIHYFFAWVTNSQKDGGGGGGKKWVHEHIHTYINIAGAQLGVPKATPALMSGEMRDTVVMGPLGTLVEQFIGRKSRRDLWSTWGSLWSMLPKGGDAIWAIGADINHTSETGSGLENPDIGDKNRSLTGRLDRDVVPFFVMTHKPKNDTAPPQNETCANQNLTNSDLHEDALAALKSYSKYSMPTIEQTIDFLSEWGAGKGPKLSSPNHVSFDKNEKSPKKLWHDLTKTPLPYAPDMKIYCMYGVGLDTERAYFYKRNEEDSGDPDNSVNDPPFLLDTSVENPAHKIKHGIKYTDGDQSVALMSLGYMCADAWRRKDSGLNPSNTKVITREYKHRQEFDSGDPMRSGPYSADHVDILGNIDMMEDFMKIVTGDEVDDQFSSKIREISKEINKHPNGGIFKKRTRRK